MATNTRYVSKVEINHGGTVQTASVPIYANGNAIYRLKGNGVDYIHKYVDTLEDFNLTLSAGGTGGFRIVWHLTGTGPAYETYCNFNRGSPFLGELNGGSFISGGTSTFDVSAVWRRDTRVWAKLHLYTTAINSGKLRWLNSNINDHSASSGIWTSFTPSSVMDLSFTVNLVNAVVQYPSGAQETVTKTLNFTNFSTIDGPTQTGTSVKEKIFHDEPMGVILQRVASTTQEY
jgi:hypothetical protein